MKVHLVFPPVWLTEIPYLSVPALRAYVGHLPGVSVRSLDLNVQLWREIRSERSLASLLEWSRRKLAQLGTVRSREDLDLALRLRVVAGHDLPELLGRVANRRIPVPVLQSCLKMYFKEAILGLEDGDPLRRWQQDRDYHDPYMSSISLSRLAASAESLLGSLRGSDRENPYLRLMPTLYRQLAGDEVPDLLGVSVTAVNQVVPALALSAWIRTHYSHCRILWGGQWLTHVLDRPQDLAPLFDIVDGMVAGEGEVPLASVLKREAEGGTWDEVPNLFLRKQGQVVPPKHVFQSPNLNHLPTPDFSDIPLEEFDYPGILPLQTSRGCSWNHCRFCSYVTLDPVYKKRAVGHVVDDMEALLGRYSLRELAFTDAIMEPEHFLAISDEILRRGVRIKWRGFARFDRHFTATELERMGEAGCSFIIWGMESGSERILRLMKKGTNRQIAQQNLRDASLAGIHNRVCLIYGYPTESGEDRDLTVGFLRQNLDFVHSMAFSALSVERGTPLAEGPEAAALDGLGAAHELGLELPRHAGPVSLTYLRETEQALRALYLSLERKPPHEPAVGLPV